MGHSTASAVLVFATAAATLTGAGAAQQPATGSAQQPGAGTAEAKPQSFGLPLTGEAAEEFLKKAKLVDRKPLGEGVTRADRLTLSDGVRTHRAIFKTIHERKLGLQRLEAGGYEFDFRDSWKSEVAAYELDKLLELGLVPPTVQRNLFGRTGSLQLWVDGAMTEADRSGKGLEPPDSAAWNAQMYRVRLLHQLSGNTDFRNVRNILVDPAFRVYAVDSSRAFRIQPELLAPGDLTRFSRSVVERLVALDAKTLESRLGRWLGKMQLEGLLARRDAILAIVEERRGQHGEEGTFDP